ncbi:MAG: asparagine synthase (glutamine-hydrolyzing) [Methylococcaceae bacterium]|nr:asparagine synthase (glutamine-hydrolyzing) [Methylococcaceae bacterium]
MCGIVGKITSNLTDNDSLKLKAAMKSINHRGPDADGIWSSESVIFGHKRLSIIDLATGTQPMEDINKRYCIVFNGELYNYIEIRDELISNGVMFKSKSDTEVILNAFIFWGKNCLTTFNGMFAFAIWDKQTHSLFAARDPLGEKGFYYYFDGTQFIFASEPKAIFEFGIAKDFAGEFLQDYLIFRSIRAPNTFFKGIFKLDAGESLSLSADFSLKIEKYWSLPHKSEILTNTNELDITEELIHRLKDAIKIRMRSDVPIGMFLSGGVDSSLLTALAVEEMGSSVLNTFSVAVKDWKQDESEYQNMVSTQYGTNHLALHLDESHFINEIDQYIYHCDDIVGDPSAVALQILSQKVKASGTTVVLAGEGADEIFGGYSSYSKFFSLRKIRQYKLLKSLLSLAPTIHKMPNLKPITESIYCFSGTANLYSYSDISQLVKTFSDYIPLKFGNESSNQTLRDLLVIDVENRLPNDLFMRTDRATMAYSLESRLPFMDPSFVSWAMSIPDTYKIKNGVRKYILKKASEPYLPKELLYRKKVGFDLPIEKWLRGVFSADLQHYFERDQMINELNYDYISSIYKSWLNGNSYLTYQIWNLFFIERWYRKWFT